MSDDEQALERRGAVDLMQLPRLLGGALTDLRTIAGHMATLPKLLVSLDRINERVASLDDEVKQMRAAVETMSGDVSELNGGITRLETHLDDVNLVAHPLRRLGSKRRRTAAEPDA